MFFFRNVVFIAALAGLVAAAVMTGLQVFSTVPLILKAETYEQAPASDGHDHDHAAHHHESGEASHASGHHHDPDAWQPADGFERTFFTALANVVTGVGFALILVAVSELAGGMSGWRQGLYWGLGGFAAFTLAPGLGLPPELPGMPAADLGARQLWWWATVAATAAGLALVVFRRSVLFAALGLAIIIAPHIVGAPQPVDPSSPVPPDLHHRFVVAVTLSNLVFWAVLGSAAGYLRQRFLPRGENLQPRLA